MYDVSKEKHTSSKIGSTTLFYPKAANAIYLNGFLIGPFDPSSNGYHYTLAVICMLTGYPFCIPLKIKTSSKVVQTYLDKVYTKFRGSMKILSDNGTECKNNCSQMWLPSKMWNVKFFHPYHPQSNSRIEGFHNFLKACMSKHVSQSLEWDQLIPLACTTYNFLPNEHSKESPLSLCFVETLLFH